MNYTLAIAALLSESAAISTDKQGIEWNINRPYGPYFKETNDFPRAFGRPSDASLEHDGYGDSAGQHTGTLSQVGNQGIEYNTHRPYGPYFKETNDFPRAFGRPSDASLEHDGYGDSAGQHTGTLSQLRSRDPKEPQHTDRTYGPYFDDKERDGAPVKLGHEDGRDENMPYGPYQVEGHGKCEVGKNGSCIIPGHERPEDRKIVFPAYKDAGGENGFIYIPEHGLYLMQTPKESYAAKADSLEEAKATAMKQLYTMDAW